MKLLIKDIEKANHFIAGTILYCFFVTLLNPVFSFFLMYTVAFFKEYFDDKPNSIHTLFTVLGALPVFILLIVKNVVLW